MRWIRILMSPVLFLNKLSILMVKSKINKRNAIKVFHEQLKKDGVPIEVSETLTKSYEQMVPLELNLWKKFKRKLIGGYTNESDSY